MYYVFLRKKDKLLYIDSKHIVSVYDVFMSPERTAAVIVTTNGSHLFKETAKELIKEMERQKEESENMLHFRKEPDISESMIKAAYPDGDAPQIVKDMVDFKERLSNLPPQQ